MSRHRITVSVGDEHWKLLQMITEVSPGRRVGDVVRDMVIEMLDSLQEAFSLCEGETSEAAKRKLVRIGLNKMLDISEDITP